jgi:hypothetical protein
VREEPAVWNTTPMSRLGWAGVRFEIVHHAAERDAARSSATRPAVEGGAVTARRSDRPARTLAVVDAERDVERDGRGGP